MFKIKSEINPFALAKRINRPLILDGAMGSMLQQIGNKPEGSMWMSMINLTHPEQVLRIHEQYILAGADIITTNTFRTNPAAIDNYKKKIDINKLIKQSVGIAIDAAKDLPVFIAGSNAPAEDCYQVQRKISKKALELNHKEHIELLIDNGCHFILNETQSHFDEIKLICNYCSKNKIPYIISLFTNENLKLLSGERIEYVINFILDYSPLAISLNCIRQETFFKFFNRPNFDFNWGTYLNCGSGEFTDEDITCGVSPVEYNNLIKKILVKSPSFIGACCGSSPEHIKQIKMLLDGNSKN
ncbi:MAG: homocysteine S-methyltransferase family protein [Bacteroidetes bacterium]|nr:homocysteine S-methyltransferase family protein [Bacteroidota bacterium]